MNVLCMHKGVKAVPATPDQLEALNPPIKLGPRHLPIHHFDVWQQATRTFEINGYEVTDTEVLLSEEAEHFRSMQAFALRDKLDRFDTTQGRNGLVAVVLNCNKQAFSLRLYAGQITFACDNMALHGVQKEMRRRHTTGLDFAGYMADMVGEFTKQQTQLANLRRTIASFRELDDTQRKAILWDCQAFMPNSAVLKAGKDLLTLDGRRSMQELESDEVQGGEAVYAALTRSMRGYAQPWQSVGYLEAIPRELPTVLERHAGEVIEVEVVGNPA